MKKKLYLFAIIAVMALSTKAQIYYSFSASSGTYTPVTGGTAIAAFTQLSTGAGVSSPATDDGFRNNISIGFTFNYLGTNYTRLNVCTNGFVAFGSPFASTASTTAPVYLSSHNLDGSGSVDSAYRPIIAPFWGDLDIQTAAAGGGVVYRTTGATPNRVFTLQWTNVLWDYGATTSALSFQLKLYETSNKIEFVYRKNAGDIFSSDTSRPSEAGIGLTAKKRGLLQFYSVQDTTITATVSKISEAAIFGRPETGTTYTFTPIAAIAKDAGVSSVLTVSKTATVADPQEIGVIITNGGTDNLTGVPVTLNIDGANSYTSTVNVNINAGTSTYVPFTGFQPTNQGTNFITASVPSDDDNSNNSSPLFSQTVTKATVDFTSATPTLGMGQSTSTIDLAAKFKNSNPHTINSLLLNFVSNPSGDQPYTVSIYDASGTTTSGSTGAPGSVLWASDPLTSTTGAVTVPITPALTVTGDYIVVISQTDNTASLRYGYENESPLRLQTFYFQTPTTNGWVDFASSTVPFVKLSVGVLYDSTIIPVPVSYARFSGTRIENKINKLTWTTATELNNSGFEIQSSLDGKNFEKKGFVKTQSIDNSNRGFSYEFNDAVNLNGTIYYRLKQIDKDGRFSYSSIISIKSTGVTTGTTLNPNPVRNEATLSVNTKNSTSATVVIADIAGKVIAKYPIQVAEGNNNFNLNLGSLKAGSYVLKINGVQDNVKPVLFEKK